MKIAVCFSSDYMAHCEYQISHGMLLYIHIFLQKFREINFFTVCGSITMMLLIDFTKVILRIHMHSVEITEEIYSHSILAKMS